MGKIFLANSVTVRLFTSTLTFASALTFDSVLTFITPAVPTAPPGKLIIVEPPEDR